MKSLLNKLNEIAIGSLVYRRYYKWNEDGVRSVYKILEIDQDFVTKQWLGNYKCGVLIHTSDQSLSTDAIYEYLLYPYEIDK